MLKPLSEGTDQRLVLQTVVEEENFGGREEFVEETTTVEVDHFTGSTPHQSTDPISTACRRPSRSTTR